MPEGDTVYRAARLLHRALAGKVLLRTDFRVPQLATTDLAGAVVTESVSRGKHLLTRIDDAEQGRSWTLHTHLKMEGTWRVVTPGQRWPRPEHQARVVLHVAGASAVGFSLGIVELVARAEEDDVVGHLGPDLLGPDWDEQLAVRRLLEQPERAVGESLLDRTRPAGMGEPSTTGTEGPRTIHEALLDQRNLAGIGNMWAAETLFLTGVDPVTAVPEVPDVHKLVRMAYRLLQANKERPIQATTGSTRRGEERYVYARAGKPCRRCGTRIRTGELGPLGRERVTYWCPSCQPRQPRRPAT